MVNFMWLLGTCNEQSKLETWCPHFRFVCPLLDDEIECVAISTPQNWKSSISEKLEWPFIHLWQTSWLKFLPQPHDRSLCPPYNWILTLVWGLLLQLVIGCRIICARRMCNYFGKKMLPPLKNDTSLVWHYTINSARRRRSL